MPGENRRQDRVYLIGLPGSGKTTLGRRLAAELGWPFVDLDEAIEQEAGRLIADIFGMEGEAGFREREAATLRRVGLQTPLVLATGGGTPCFHESMTWLLAHGQVVWLDVDPARVAGRLAASRLAARPLLAAKKQAAAPVEATREALTGILRQTLAARKPFYARAPLRCADEACSAAEVRRLLGLT